MFWGDGTSSFLKRTNGNGTEIPGEDIKINYYTSTHTYASRATYTLSFEDPNRVNNILNVNYPNSVEIPFYLETTFTLLNSQFSGLNSSVKLLQPPLDFACINQRFIHNPTAFDPDGDSISYEIIKPMEAKNMAVPNYLFPDEILPTGPDNKITLNPITGDFIWDSPKTAGEYNIALKVNEHRNGEIISSTIRDMQIFVDICNNTPPIIETIDEYCIIAGEQLSIDINIDDLDKGQKVLLTATGGPFLVDESKAQIIGPTTFFDVPFNATFIWNTKCSHIREQYYQVVLRAEDDFGNGQGLVTLKTIRIKVLGPKPENVTIEKSGEDVKLKWERFYTCDTIKTQKFIGFSIWRKEGSNLNVPDSCFNGLANTGYTKIEYITANVENDSYVYIDDDIDKTRIYCYRILGNFAQLTNSGIPFNIVESIASDEVCIQLSEDVPYMTKVSVINTSPSAGGMQVEWILPNPEKYDTVSNTGPFEFSLQRKEEGGTFSTIQDWTNEQFSDFQIVNFTDLSLNTENLQYVYQLLIKSNQTTKKSRSASSIYLDINPNDKQNRLVWSSNVPWQNFKYYIYRNGPVNTQYELIDSTISNNYIDFGIENGEEYCYYIEGFGTYGIDVFPFPLMNLSQENCGIPQDLSPPCTPDLLLTSICDILNENPEAETLFNTLEWNVSFTDCPENEDIEGFNIYSLDEGSSSFTLVETINDKNSRSFIDEREDILSSCYKISAYDEVGNESELSEVVCGDICAIYQLPNTFTPNNDGTNDFFKPRKNLFIDEINFKVYNKWGNLVFETKDPQINWDGNGINGREVDSGTYYYHCEVIQATEGGILETIDTLSGYIEVLR